MSDVPSRATLGQLAAVFLRLGTTAFGGPAAHIAMMEKEVVGKRGWLTREKFLDLVGAANLIPGPNSTELAIHIGLDQRGWRGLLVAGACFIVPAVVIVMAIAWAYVEYAALPEVTGLMAGIKPVILAVIAQALWNLGRSALKTWWLGVIAVWALAAIVIGVHELAVLGAAGAFACAFVLAKRRRAAALREVIVPLLPICTVAVTGAPAVGLPAVFGFFVKIGSILYGSGYVLVAYLRSDLVERWHWLTETQLLDAIAVGQVTPGPVFTTATFVGYVVAGPAGALVATAGIFLPAFVFVAISGPLVPRIRRSAVAGAFLDGVTVASLAMMLWAGVLLGAGTFAGVDVIAIVTFAIATLLLVRWRVDATWLVGAGALLGIARTLVE